MTSGPGRSRCADSGDPTARIRGGFPTSPSRKSPRFAPRPPDLHLQRCPAVSLPQDRPEAAEPVSSPHFVPNLLPFLASSAASSRGAGRERTDGGCSSLGGRPFGWLILAAQVFVSLTKVGGKTLKILQDSYADAGFTQPFCLQRKQRFLWKSFAGRMLTTRSRYK